MAGTRRETAWLDVNKPLIYQNFVHRSVAIDQHLPDLRFGDQKIGQKIPAHLDKRRETAST